MKARLALRKEEEAFPSISIVGKKEWEEILDERIELTHDWKNIFGEDAVSLGEFLHKKAELEKTNFIRCLVHEFLRRKYKFEALEVTFSGPIGYDWGYSVWYKKHPLYKVPFEKDLFGKQGDKRLISSLWNAMFRTELKEDRDQRFCLYSIEMLDSDEILLHKTIVFHKIRFSPPKLRRKRRRKGS